MKKTVILVLILGSYYTSSSQFKEKYFVKNININNEYSNACITYYGDDVVLYSSSMITSVEGKLMKPKNSDFYFGFIDEYGDIIKSERLTGKANSKYDEIDLVFTSNYDVVYFTRKSKGKYLELFKADVVSSNRWKNIKKLPFNKKHTTFGYPCLSEDNKTLYFVSNMKNTLGKLDIFKVAIFDKNKYGNPENLGPRINSIGNETTPFIINNTLYFSSDRRGGFGGLDIFSIDLLNNDSNASNLGEPINSSNDEFAFIRRRDMNMGYFTSNRNNKKENNDIYSFQKLINTSKEVIKETVKKEAVLSSEKEDKIIIEKDNVAVKKDTKIVSSTIPKTNKVVNNTALINDQLGYDMKQYLKCQKDLDKVGNVYFGLNKTHIAKNASLTLNKVIRIMKRCPQFKIIASSHTDSRATYKYNINLSQRRANSVAAYIILKGNFSSKTIKSVGYGEEQLRNRCSNGIKCKESEHRINRRTEFEISNF